MQSNIFFTYTINVQQKELSQHAHRVKNAGAFLKFMAEPELSTACLKLTVRRYSTLSGKRRDPVDTEREIRSAAKLGFDKCPVDHSLPIIIYEITVRIKTVRRQEHPIVIHHI